MLNWSGCIHLSLFSTGLCRWKGVLLNVQHRSLQSSCSSSRHVPLTRNTKFPPARSGMPKPILWLLPGWKIIWKEKGKKINEYKKKAAFPICLFVLVLANAVIFPAFFCTTLKAKPRKAKLLQCADLSWGYCLARVSCGEVCTGCASSSPHMLKPFIARGLRSLRDAGGVAAGWRHFPEYNPMEKTDL